MKNAMWIWNGSELTLRPEMVAFRKTFTPDRLPDKYEVQVCADSRYCLWVNSRRVSSGPARSGASERYYDTVDLAPYLHAGENVLYVEAVHYAETPLTRNTFSGGPISVETTPVGGFLLQDPGEFELSTNESWECGEVEGYSFLKTDDRFMYMGYTDSRDYRIPIRFFPAVVRYDSEPYVMGGLANIWTVSPRPIPMTYERPERFADVLYCSNADRDALLALMGEDVPLLIPPHTSISFLADPGLYRTAFPFVQAEGGRDAEIQWRYTEKYGRKHLDEYAVVGRFPDEMGDVFVTDGKERDIRPFLYRAFRFLTVRIRTANEPLHLHRFGFIRTGYPLTVTGGYDASEPFYADIWKTGLNTLECCMYETYMDCPYYEQMQYTMDTILQMAYSFQVSSDDRLARKAIDDFARAQLHNGMIPCTAPAGFTQIIPGFSVYWIMMLYIHYRYYGDSAFISQYIPELEKLLSFYINHMNSRTGLIENTGYWQFVDWVCEWERGCPSRQEDNYIYSMMVSYAFRLASELYGSFGDLLRAQTYMTYADSLNASLNTYAWSETEQVYLDAPGTPTRSQHAQLWAVLAEVCTGQRALTVLQKALNGHFSKTSYSMSFFLFRAMEKAGLYDLTRGMLTQWQKFVLDGATTYPEDPVTMRSECHAWGAVPLYDFAACHLGITPLKGGYEAVRIQPKALWLTRCEGTVATCKGDIEVAWSIHHNRFSIRVFLPRETEAELVLPNGEKRIYTHTKVINETCVFKESATAG